LTAKEVGPLSAHEVYMKTCVDFIRSNDCPNSLICGVNCASDTNINVTATKVVPVNNFGQKYLRVRTCSQKLHQQIMDRYQFVNMNPCVGDDQFDFCNRFIPPSTFGPVALPFDTTYFEIDECEISGTVDAGNSDLNPVYEYTCDQDNPARLYGNELMFPVVYNVLQVMFRD
jgi:hypothetical protein